MKEFAKAIERLVWYTIFIALVVVGAISFLGMMAGEAQAAEPQLQGKTIVVNTQSGKPVDTGYTIEVKGVRYTIYRGPRGGMFYLKDGKKVYLTKTQKELIK